ncbi:MAG TPA: hypothetical protein VIT68_00600 [Candidatus Gracilibacteria bacterium]
MKYYYLLGMLVCCGFPSVAQAYFGMGPLLPMLGNAFVVMFAFFAAIIGIVAYPMKMTWDAWRGKNNGGKPSKKPKK